MKKSAVRTCLAVVLSLVFFAGESHAFRCGSGLVTTGDSKTKVLLTCGQPTNKERSCEDPKEYRTKDAKVKKAGKCSKKGEVWYYNCGENDFIYALTFVNGKLVKEETEGRGKGKSDCLGK